MPSMSSQQKMRNRQVITALADQQQCGFWNVTLQVGVGGYVFFFRGGWGWWLIMRYVIKICKTKLEGVYENKKQHGGKIHRTYDSIHSQQNPQTRESERTTEAGLHASAVCRSRDKWWKNIRAHKTYANAWGWNANRMSRRGVWVKEGESGGGR